MPISRQKFEIFFQNVAFDGRRILGYGFSGIAKRIVIRTLRLLLGTLFLPISLGLHLAGYRRLETFTARIGHLAIEPDLILKAQRLGLIKPRKWILAAPTGKVANSHMLRYWSQHFVVAESKLICFALDCLTFWGFNRLRTSFLINEPHESQLAYEIYSRWGGNGSLLSVTEDDQQWFVDNKLKLGLPPNCWYVCVHAREGGFSPVDEEIQGYRNSSVENLNLAVEEIVHRGGWIVRLGDPTTTKLPPMANVIDYAHSPERSERMDILLCANARFILGNTSGIALVGSVFGVPCALANMVPMSTLGIGKGDISIPKMHIDRSTGRLMTFGEVMSSPVSNFRHKILYEKAGISLEENSAEEILLLTKRMLCSLESNHMSKDKTANVGDLFLAMFRPGHYSFGSQASVCEEFFVKYTHLL